MNTALPTASSAYGPDRPSAAATVDNATPQGSTYRRGNSVQTNWAGSLSYPSACLIAQQAQVAFLAVNGDGRFLVVHEFVSIVKKTPALCREGVYAIS
jgi:hypothetical protein